MGKDMTTKFRDPLKIKIEIFMKYKIRNHRAKILAEYNRNIRWDVKEGS